MSRPRRAIARPAPGAGGACHTRPPEPPSQPRPAFAPAPPAPLRRRGRRRRRTAARSANGSLSGALRRLLHAVSLPAPLAAGRRPLRPAAPYWSGGLSIDLSLQPVVAPPTLLRPAVRLKTNHEPVGRRTDRSGGAQGERPAPTQRRVLPAWRGRVALLQPCGASCRTRGPSAKRHPMAQTVSRPQAVSLHPLWMTVCDRTLRRVGSAPAVNGPKERHIHPRALRAPPPVVHAMADSS